MLQSGWIGIYFAGRVAALVDGLDVGGEKKKGFQGKSQIWGWSKWVVSDSIY